MNNDILNQIRTKKVGSKQRCRAAIQKINRNVITRIVKK